MERRRPPWWLWVIIGVVVVALLVGGVALLFSGVSAPNPAGQTPAASATPTPTRSTAPTATASASPRPTPSTTPSPTPTASATPTAPPVTPTVAPVVQVGPFISSATWDATSGALLVSAFVPGVVESNGTCTVTATSGDATVSQSFGALAAATSTDCGSITMTSPDFAPGSWNVVVAYESATSAGESAPTQVELP